LDFFHTRVRQGRVQAGWNGHNAQVISLDTRGGRGAATSWWFAPLPHLSQAHRCRGNGGSPRDRHTRRWHGHRTRQPCRAICTSHCDLCDPRGVRRLMKRNSDLWGLGNLGRRLNDLYCLETFRWAVGCVSSERNLGREAQMADEARVQQLVLQDQGKENLKEIACTNCYKPPIL
jgi:hypothetical protein